MTTEDAFDVVRDSFAPDQLRIARELRCWTQTELARKAVDAGHRRGLTAAAISQFELGISVPNSDTIGALVAALTIEPEFLTVDAVDTETHIPAFFRSLRATPARNRKQARNFAQLVHRLTALVERHVELPGRDVPEISCDPFLDEERRRTEAEEAAETVRRRWGLPAGPIANMIGTLEEHGVVCTRLLLNDYRVDAFSVNFTDHPVVVLAMDKDKWDRSRFDAAHELGHLVMHEGAAGLPEAERQAHEFAAAFLMPEADIKDVLPLRADWAALMALKAEWGTSIASLLRRASTLGAMSPSNYLTANKVLSARGWRKHEPVEGESESPTLLRQALERAEELQVAPEDLRRDAAIPKDLFDEICRVISAE